MTSDLHARAKAVVGAMTVWPWTCQATDFRRPDILSHGGSLEVAQSVMRSNALGIALLRNTADAALAVIDVLYIVGMDLTCLRLFTEVECGKCKNCRLRVARDTYEAALAAHFEREGK